MKANQPSPPYRLIRSWNLMNGRISLFALFLLFLFTGTIAFLGTRQVRTRALAAEAPPLTQAEVAAFVQSAAPRGPQGEAQIFIAPGRERRWGQAFAFERDGQDIGGRDLKRRLQRLEEGAESAHFEGLLQLWKAWRETGPKAQYFREAEQSLIAALETEPERASAWNDLAVVYLTWAQQLDRPRLYLDAYAATHAALSLDGDLAEARFNQALTLEKLGLFQQAAAALEKPWPSGAESIGVEDRRARLETLDPVTLHLDFVRDLEDAAEKRDRARFLAVASRFPPAAGRWVEEKLLPRWAEEAEQNGIESAEDLLAMARDLGAILATPRSEILGDPMLAETVATIDRSVTAADRETLRSLIGGHRDFGRGMADFPDRAQDAKNFFEKSARELQSGGSAFANWATFYLGACRHLQRDLAGAMAAFDQLQVSGSKFPFLAVRTGWGRALLFNQLDQLRSALAAYGPTGDLAAALEDHQSVAAISYQEAEAEAILGRHDETWRRLAPALRMADSPILARYRVSIFFTAADRTSLEKMGWPPALQPTARDAMAALTLLFQRQAVEDAERSGSVPFIIQNRGRLASFLKDQGKQKEAEEQYRLAEASIQNLPDKLSRDYHLADLILANAADKVAPASEADLEEALGIFREQQFPFREVQLALALAEQANRRSDAGAREEWLEKALRVVEDLASGLEPMQDRYGYLAALHDTFRARILVALQSSGGPELALRLYLREQQMQRKASGAPPKSVATPGSVTVPPEAAFIAWLEFSDGSLQALIVTATGVTARKLRIDATKLRKTVAEMRAAVDRTRESDSSDATELMSSSLTQLSEQLISPVEDLLQGNKNLGLSLDDAFAGVPFEALFVAENQRLVQKFLVSRVATPEMLSEELSRLEDPYRGALVIGAGKPAATWDLKDLPHVETEIDAIDEKLGLEPESILRGLESTRSRVLGKLPAARWIHFAGHSITDPHDPLSSLLIFADEPGRITALSGVDLAQLGRGRLELVVLAGCDTALSNTSGLAQGLERGGVPVIIGSHWPVSDELTSILFEEFYQLLEAGVPPVQALRETQLTALSSDDRKLASPATWAAFAAWGW